jgi:hypothetical protein
MPTRLAYRFPAQTAEGLLFAMAASEIRLSVLPLISLEIFFEPVKHH